MTQTQTHPTAKRIDRTERANLHPDEASKADIAAALEGRQLADGDLVQKVAPYCKRCKQKNRKRRLVDVDEQDPYIEDGDGVQFFAHHADPDDAFVQKHWKVTTVYHQRHQHVAIGDAAEAGIDLVRARARVHKTERHEHFVDVDVLERSHSDDGPEQSLVMQRQERYIDDSDEHPDGMTVISIPDESPPAEWPNEEREWLRQLLADHDRVDQNIPDLDIANVLEDAMTEGER